jgi:hypothetical protein
MALELVCGADFWCNRHCRTSCVVLEGFGGQVWPNIGRQPAQKSEFRIANESLSVFIWLILPFSPSGGDSRPGVRRPSMVSGRLTLPPHPPDDNPWFQAINSEGSRSVFWPSVVLESWSTKATKPSGFWEMCGLLAWAHQASNKPLGQQTTSGPLWMNVTKPYKFVWFGGHGCHQDISMREDQ